MRSIILSAVVAISMGVARADHLSSPGYYGGYGMYGPMPGPDILPTEPTAPEPMAPDVSIPPRRDVRPIEPIAPMEPEGGDEGCIPEECVPGDKIYCETLIPPLEEGADNCCEDEYCSVCHQNGCNQCCPFTFKADYQTPCIPCCEYDENCMFCQDFGGCGSCADGYVLTMVPRADTPVGACDECST